MKQLLKLLSEFVQDNALKYRDTVYIIRNNNYISFIPDEYSDSSNVLETAISQIKDGDTIILGNNSVYRGVNLTINANNIKVFGNNSTILRQQDTIYEYILLIKGNDILVQDLHVHGDSQANTGRGEGFRLNGNNIQLKNIDCGFTRGAQYGPTPNGVASAIILSGSNISLDGYSSNDAGYSSIRLANGKNVSINNFVCKHSLNRSITADGTESGGFLNISNGYCWTDRSECKIGSNINTKKVSPFDVVRFSNVTMNMEVKYNSNSREQLMKFEGIDTLYLKDINLTNKHNTGGGFSQSIAFDPDGVENVLIQNCWFSSGIAWGPRKNTVTVENSHFGMSDPQIPNGWFTVDCKTLSITNSEFRNLDYAIAFSEDVQAEDKVILHNNIFNVTKDKFNSNGYKRIIHEY
jgi:hypothetical protein